MIQRRLATATAAIVLIAVLLVPTSAFAQALADNGPVDVKVAWVNGSAPYTDVGKGLTNAGDADLLVLYEREDDHGGDGMNLLFAERSVWWESMDTAKQIIAAKRRPKNAAL